MYGISKGSNILDTLLLQATASPEPNVNEPFRSTGFYLKDHHALRTFEAYQQIKHPVLLTEVHALYNSLEKDLLLKYHGTQQVVRLVFSAQEMKYTLSVTPYQQLTAPLRLQVLSSLKATSGQGLQNYKWEQRDFWSIALTKKSEKADDIISVNEKNNIVETSRFNLFFYSEKEGFVLTPSLESGCINGVFRRHAVQKGYFDIPNVGSFRLFEKTIPIDDITRYQIYVANSVRGVLPSVLFSE